MRSQPVVTWTCDRCRVQSLQVSDTHPPGWYDAVLAGPLGLPERDGHEIVRSNLCPVCSVALVRWMDLMHVTAAEEEAR